MSKKRKRRLKRAREKNKDVPENAEKEWRASDYARRSMAHLEKLPPIRTRHIVQTEDPLATEICLRVPFQSMIVGKLQFELNNHRQNQ